MNKQHFIAAVQWAGENNISLSGIIVLFDLRKEAITMPHK